MGVVPLCIKYNEFLGCYWHGNLYLPNTGSDLQRERMEKTRLHLQYTVELETDGWRR